MSSDPREETVFNEAVARPVADRPGFLDGVCGDNDAFRARVEALIAAHAEDASHLDRGAAVRPAVAAEGVARAVKLGECALALLTAGEIASANAQRNVALEHWERALGWLQPRLGPSRDWRLLDPAARMLIRLGRAEEGRAIIRRLHELSYRPLDPWPPATASGTSVSPTENQPGEKS